MNTEEPVVQEQDKRPAASLLQQKLVDPVLRMLWRGASPKRLAWSLAVGFVIGINPLPGSTTLATLALTQIFKLKHAASQIGTHSAYGLQLLLLLPFLHAGAVVFHTAPVPLQKREFLALTREHPVQLFQSLWMWEWHALVLWLGVAVLLTPAIALLLTHVLERATASREGTVSLYKQR